MIVIKTILLIGTGGTIASSSGPKGLAPIYSIDRLLELIPEVSTMCNIHSLQICNIDSTNIQPGNWIEIVTAIRENYLLYDGFVITHGTDTMAYTAAILSYMIQNSRKPIVITGSQKPIYAKNTDAKRNVINSIRFACENIGGVYITFDGKVINGCRAVKIRTKSNNAYESINLPVVAKIKRGIVQFNPLYPFSTVEKELKFFTVLENDVFLLKLTPGLNSNVFNFVKTKCKGVVIESYGNGGIPFTGETNILTEVKDLAASGIIFVITTQCLLEGGNLNLYEVGRNIMKSRVIPAYDMTTEAAMAKLMWAMGQVADFESVRDLFLTPVQNDIMIPCMEALNSNLA